MTDYRTTPNFVAMYSLILNLFVHRCGRLFQASQFFRVVAYQIVDDKLDNVMHVLAVIDNSGIPWGDVIVPNGVQTIKVTCILSLVGGSIINQQSSPAIITSNHHH